MKIRFSQHFTERTRLRGIPDDLGERVLREADGHYRNGITGWLIAIKRLQFQGKERDWALPYALQEDEIVPITLHPLKKEQKRPSR